MELARQTDACGLEWRAAICADFDAYWDAEASAAAWYRDRRRWARMALHDIAGSAWFSSDTTISAYAR